MAWSASRHSLLLSRSSSCGSSRGWRRVCCTEAQENITKVLFCENISECMRSNYLTVNILKEKINHISTSFFLFIVIPKQICYDRYFLKYNYLSSKPWLCRRLEISCQKTFYQPVKYKDQLVLHSTKSSSEIMSLQNLIFQGMFCKEAAYN